MFEVQGRAEMLCPPSAPAMFAISTAFGGKADIVISQRKCLLLTQSGH